MLGWEYEHSVFHNKVGGISQQFHIFKMDELDINLNLKYLKVYEY